jgi:hypothetical protein
MSLSQRLDDMKPKETGLPCGVARATSEMSDKDRASFESHLSSIPRVLSNAQLQEALISEGYDVSYSSISLHRRRQCRCYVGRTTRMATAT